MIDPKQIIELAKEIEQSDPFYWSNLPIHRDAVYSMLGLAVLERLEGIDARERDAVITASLVKLTVENFVLEMRLLSNK